MSRQTVGLPEPQRQRPQRPPCDGDPLAYWEKSHDWEAVVDRYEEPAARCRRCGVVESD